MSDITATMLQDKLNSIERNAYDGIDFSQEVTTAYVLADELGERIDQLSADNAKLRELCADMYGFIKRMDEDCGDVTFSDCFDYCKHDTADDGCCKTGECWYEQRLRELGIEVGG